MGQKIEKAKPVVDVPGPGTYNSPEAKKMQETVKSSKFGNEKRSSLENPNAKKVPGPGEHSPDYK